MSYEFRGTKVAVFNLKSNHKITVEKHINEVCKKIRVRGHSRVHPRDDSAKRA
jgi:hypothetical protein